MDHTISMYDGEMRATPNERFRALKRRAVPPDYQQELGDDDLHKIMDRDVAMIKGDVEKFIDALEKVIEGRKLALSLILNQVTPFGNSLLHVATSSGSDDVMELILIHFPHTMTRKNSSEDTPLHVAVQDKRLDTTKKLICRRMDSEIIYWKNEDGKSPLHLPIEKCKLSEWQDCNGAGWGILQLLLLEFARDKAYLVKKQGMSPVLAAIGDTGNVPEAIAGHLASHPRRSTQEQSRQPWMAAPYESGLVTDITKGNNMGRVLSSEFVVRRLDKLCTTKDVSAKKTVSRTVSFPL